MSEVMDFDDVSPDDRGALRNALLDQLAYLVAEAEALKTVVGTVPDDVQSGRPTPDDLTMKEAYGVIATLDDDVRTRRVDRIVAEDTPALEPVDVDALARDADWNDQPMDAVLDAVRDARQRLVEHLKAVDEADWARRGTLDDTPMTLFELVHRAAKADLERLRTIGHRLHDANLSK